MDEGRVIVAETFVDAQRASVRAIAIDQQQGAGVVVHAIAMVAIGDPIGGVLQHAAAVAHPRNGGE